MQPSGLQWTFNICANPKQYAAVFPQPANGVCFSYTSTGTQVSGASVDLSSSFAATTIPVTGGAGGGVPPNVINAGSSYGVTANAKRVTDAHFVNGSSTIECTASNDG